MKIIEPCFEILSDISDNGTEELKKIEQIARTCYKSEDKISDDSAEKLVRYLIKNGHTAMLEHSQLSIKFTIDRGVSHELVRHRHCGFAQESTRYCNYSKDKFGNEITVVFPSVYITSDYSGEIESRFATWRSQMKEAELAYFRLLKQGATPQEARAVLPNSLKTELVITASYREWRSIFSLRCASDAHPDTRYIMRKCLDDIKTKIPVVFNDIEY